MSIDFHSTVIFCNDLKEQRDFYEKFLGQNVVNDLGVCIVFENGFTLWKLKSEYPISEELGYTYEPIGNRNFELSYKRALALYSFWKIKKIEFKPETCDIQIAGSGTGGVREYSGDEEYKNQQFLIHIVPKIGKKSEKNDKL